MGEAFAKEALYKAGFSPRDIGRFLQLLLRREPDLMTESTLKKTNWPVFRSLASFRPSDLPGDLIAGLTLAAIAILCGGLFAAFRRGRRGARGMGRRHRRPVVSWRRNRPVRGSSGGFAALT